MITNLPAKDSKKDLSIVPKTKADQATEIMNTITRKIDEKDPLECKEDLRIIITSLVEFVAGEDPEILNPATDETVVMKKFFMMLVGVGTDAMMPWKKKKLQEKFSRMMKLLPVIQRYAHVDIEG